MKMTICRPATVVVVLHVLFAMVSGLLGIAGMRSFDKMKGTDAKSVGS